MRQTGAGLYLFVWLRTLCTNSVTITHSSFLDSCSASMPSPELHNGEWVYQVCLWWKQTGCVNLGKCENNGSTSPNTSTHLVP